MIYLGRDVAGQTEVTRLMAVEALGNTIERRASQRAAVYHLFDPSVPVRYSALCALGAHFEPYPAFVVEALKRVTQDPDSLYEERDLSKFAEELLARDLTR